MLVKELNTLIILPHSDDEFALLPLLKRISKYNDNYIKIVYCAERHNSLNRYIRRKENLSALKLLGFKNCKPIFLNDYFEISGKYLYRSAKSIYDYLENLYINFQIEQILTLNYEGGHPDHDALALIVDKFAKEYKIKPFYFPAYNPRINFLIPLSVLKPLKSQEKSFKLIKYEIFCWFDLLLLIFIYKSELSAFLKLLPFLIIKIIFSRKLYYTNIIDFNSVDWAYSFSRNIYGINHETLLSYINKI